MVSNIHDTTFFIKHIQDIFFFFSVFTDVPSSAWQQAVHFGARRSSNLTRSSHVRLPLVPCLAEVRPQLPAKVKHFALFLQTPSDGSASIVLELLWRGSRLAAQAWRGGRGVDRLLISLQSSVIIRASPLHWVALNANAPTGSESGSFLKKEKCQKKM